MDKRFFSKIHGLLLHKQKEVEASLQAVKEGDPVLNDSLAESSEPGTESWRTDAHTKLIAMKENLEEILHNIKKALQNLRSGRYGKCENCGKQIEKERLEIMPEATLCVSCSTKLHVHNK